MRHQSSSRSSCPQASLVTAITHRTSSGIGLEITKQLLESPNTVVLAACRSPSNASALQDLTVSAGGRLHVLLLDVNDAESIRDAAGKAAQIVGDRGIDYLINNAGVVSCQLCSPFHIPEVL